MRIQLTKKLYQFLSRGIFALALIAASPSLYAAPENASSNTAAENQAVEDDLMQVNEVLLKECATTNSENDQVQACAQGTHNGCMLSPVPPKGGSCHVTRCEDGQLLACPGVMRDGKYGLTCILSDDDCLKYKRPASR